MMLKKQVARIVAYSGLFILTLLGVISCEQDFSDIESNFVTNNRFSTGDTIMEIQFTTQDLERVQAGGLSQAASLGQYLLGVYNNPNYEKIEASIISQLEIPTDLSIVDRAYGADTTVITTIDTVLLRIPYQATSRINDDNVLEFTIDSVIGNQNAGFTLNVFRLSSFLNNLDPTDPTRANIYYSNDNYEIFPEKLNFVEDLNFRPAAADTLAIVQRRLSNGELYETEEIRYSGSVPFIRIPLKRDRIQELFFDEYTGANFSSQDAFNNYFRGLKIQARGNDGSLVALNLANTTNPPVVDIYYTNTVLRGTAIVDTIQKVDVFPLQGIRNSEYVMSPGNVPASNNVVIQGTAGSTGRIDLFGPDNDNNGVPDGLDQLRAKNLLINDATLRLYVDQNIVGSDTISTPNRLYIFKDGLDENNEPLQTQIFDIFGEGPGRVGGFLTLDDNGRPDFYEFRITDYISELVKETRDDLEILGVKVFNTTDIPRTNTDSIIRPFSWNGRAVMLLDHQQVNGVRRATLSVSFSQENINN